MSLAALLFGNLDVLTTEGRVLAMLGQLTTLPIKSLRVAKDSLTNTSRGYAFVELNSTSEAIQLYELLLSMGGNFFVDGRQGIFFTMYCIINFIFPNLLNMCVKK